MGILLRPAGIINLLMGPSALQKMVTGERLPRKILPDVVGEAENVPGMGKHLVYPGGCSCFPS